MKISSAYSLIELSVVILIIGVLVAGISSGTGLFQKSKLRTARALTSSSYAIGVEDMVLWLDATAEASLVNGSGSTVVEDGQAIQTWNDQNPQTITKINLDSYVSEARPTYNSRGMNGLPTLFFNASADGTTGNALYISTSQLTDSATFTAFIVTRPMEIQTTAYLTYVIVGFGNSGWSGFGLRKDLSPHNFVFAGANTASYTYSYDTSLSFAVPYITTFLADGTNQIIYRNGISKDSDPSVIIPTQGNISFRIGCNAITGANNCFDGYISEIILYKRALETEERKEIEKYLGKKYVIPVS